MNSIQNSSSSSEEEEEKATISGSSDTISFSMGRKYTYEKPEKPSLSLFRNRSFGSLSTKNKQQIVPICQTPKEKKITRILSSSQIRSQNLKKEKIIKLSKNISIEKKWSKHHKKENLLRRTCKLCEVHIVHFPPFFDKEFPIAKIKVNDVADSFRYFFTPNIQEETTPFFTLNNIPLKITEDLSEKPKEKFLTWLIDQINTCIPYKSDLCSHSQAFLLCQSEKIQQTKKLVPCYPILQSLSFSAFRTAVFYLIKSAGSFFTNEIGEIHLKSFATDPPRFKIKIDSLSGKYEATQIKLYRFFRKGASEEEHLFLGQIELHWAVCGILGKAVRYAHLHFEKLKLDKESDYEVRYKILEKFGLFNL